MTVALERRCENCARTLGPSRADRRFCATACRVSAHRARRRPASGLDLRKLDLDEHLARAEAGIVASIARAAEADWQAAAFLLERRFPERWGKPRERRAGVE